MAGFFGGSALKRAQRGLRSWIPFFAAIPFLYLIEAKIASDPGLEYAFQNINHIGIAIILAVSLNLVNGLTGQFSIGHAGFMAVGAYTASVFSLSLGAHAGFTGQVLFIIAVVLGGVSLFGGSGSAIGAIFGALMFRTIGDLLFVFNVEPLWQPLFQGMVLLAAVCLGSVRLLRIRNRLDLYG